MASILLIDDDDLLRDTVLQMLEADGHQVTPAADGDQGLKLFGSGSGSGGPGPDFDLVITDMLMPGIGGARTIAEIVRSRPSQPILAISGGRRVLSPLISLDAARMAGAKAQLSKPFSRAQLQAAVASLLL